MTYTTSHLVSFLSLRPCHLPPLRLSYHLLNLLLFCSFTWFHVVSLIVGLYFLHFKRSGPSVHIHLLLWGWNGSPTTNAAHRGLGSGSWEVDQDEKPPFFGDIPCKIIKTIRLSWYNIYEEFSNLNNLETQEEGAAHIRTPHPNGTQEIVGCSHHIKDQALYMGIQSSASTKEIWRDTYVHWFMKPQRGLS